MTRDLIVPLDGSALADEAGNRECVATTKRLDAFCFRLRAQGVPAEARVAITAPIASRQNRAKDTPASLVVRTPHTRSGPSRGMQGSVALRVEAGAPRQVIERAAAAHDTGWLAVASHVQGGHGGLAPGSTALAVLRNARMPALIASGIPNV